MEPKEAANDDYKPNDYSIERLITIILSLLFLLPFIANGQETTPNEPLPTTTLGAVNDASLLLKTSTPGVYAVAPVIQSDVSIRVTGPVVRTQVRQTFRNPTGKCVEGVYVFPLPEMSAVDSLNMTIGSRVIVGEIKEREEAQRTYEKAKSEGRKAALIEQHRPNIFTTAVSTLLPDEEAVIEIQYQETAHFENGEYRLRFPMVVAPRYHPPLKPGVLEGIKLASLGNFLPPPDSTGQVEPQVSLSVELQPGYALRDVHSSHHQIETQALGNNHYQLAMNDPSLPGDRDFELVWRPDLGAKPEATVLTEKIGDQTFAIVMVTPPPQAAVALPRETIFIIDSSGSMEGASMEQARAALLLALADLRQGDRFNVIDFDSDARALFPQSRVVDASSIDDARQFVSGLQAEGGTEMMKALQLAIPGQTQPGVVRQVVFMTDGQVGNEQELFSYIRSQLGDSRLFTVGIGSAPNSHFMSNAARFGRGTFTYIGDIGQVKERMGELFGKLSAPAMTSIEVQVDDPTAEIWPSRVPDLYSGEPLFVAVQVIDPSAPIVIRGRIGNEPWVRRLKFPDPIEDSGIARLWARRKIETTMDKLSEGVDLEMIRKEVVPVALRYHLVSQFTSLVAVDQSPQGLSGATCRAELEPEIDNGALEQHAALHSTATPAQLLLMLGGLLIVISLAALRWVS